MSKAARAQLVKSVLTSIVTYHATAFPLPKWLRKKIDKLRRNFFWKGEDVEGNKGSLCLVRWDMVCKPKELGLNHKDGVGTIGPMMRGHGLVMPPRGMMKT
jgi:hypothetical protein